MTLPWLKHGFTFLTGLAEPQRRSRVLLPIQTFVDESGVHGAGNLFVMAGVMSDAETWLRFSDEWKACLDSAPKMRYFKCKEASARSKEFGRFSEDERDLKVQSLLKVLNNYDIIIIFLAIDLAAFDQAWAKDPNFPPPSPKPVFLGVQ